MGPTNARDHVIVSHIFLVIVVTMSENTVRFLSIMMMIIAFADGPTPPRNIALRVSETGTPTLIWEGVPDAARYVLTFRRPGSTIYDGILEVDSNLATHNSLFTSGEFEAVAIGTIGSNGLIGRLSQDYILPN